MKEQIEKDKQRMGEKEYKKKKEERLRKELDRIENLDEENRKYEEREREKARKKLMELERKEKEKKERGDSEETDNMVTTIYDDCRVDLSTIRTDPLFGLAVNDYRVKDKVEQLKRKSAANATSSSAASKPSSSSSASSSKASSSASASAPSSTTPSPHLRKLTSSFAAATITSPETRSDAIQLHPADDEREVLSFEEDDTDSGDADEFVKEYLKDDKTDRKYKNDVTMTLNDNWQTNPLLSYISHRIDG